MQSLNCRLMIIKERFSTLSRKVTNTCHFSRPPPLPGHPYLRDCTHEACCQSFSPKLLLLPPFSASLNTHLPPSPSFPPLVFPLTFPRPLALHTALPILFSFKTLLSVRFLLDLVQVFPTFVFGHYLNMSVPLI